MINLSIRDFLRILFSFIGIAYLLTFIYSLIIGFQLETAYEIGGEVGYNMGFVSPYILFITLLFIVFYIVNLAVNKFRLNQN